MTNATDVSLLERRLRHYRHHYAGDRLRALLLKDGFDPAAVDDALRSVAAEDALKSSLRGREASASDPVSSLAVTCAVAAVVALVDAFAPWTLVWIAGALWVMLPIAAVCVLIAVEIYVFVRLRYDAPAVSTGFAAGAVLGAVLFVVRMGAVFYSLGFVKD